MVPYSIADGGSASAIRAGLNNQNARIFRREYFPTIANNSTDAEHDLDIGAARIFVEDGSGNSAFVEFDAETIAIDGAGLDTGSVANNTWYYVWAFWNPTTGDSLYKLSASATSPTAPSGYTYKRFLCDEIAAAVRTDGSANLYAATYSGDTCVWGKEFIDLTTTSPTALANTSWTATVPPISGIEWHGNFLGNRTASVAVEAQIKTSTSSAPMRIAGFDDGRCYAAGRLLTLLGVLQYFTTTSSDWSLFSLRTTGWRVVK